MIPRPHEKTIETFASFAKAFNIEVDSDDLDKWSAGVTAGKAIDDIVDEDHDFDSGRHYEQLLQGATIPYMTDEEAEFVRDVHSRLSGESKDKWHEATHQLGSRALKRIEIDNVHDYITAIRSESPLMAGVMLVENDRGRVDYRRRKKFNTWMYPMMRYQYMADHLKDFQEDFGKGNTKVEVTKSNIDELRMGVLKDFGALALRTPVPVARKLLSNRSRSSEITLEF